MIYGVLAYAQRDLRRWIRSPMNVISTLVMPAAWLIFMGVVLPGTDKGYLDFITPGVLVMTMLNAGLFGGSSLMFDKVLGYLDKFLAAPTPRESILAGKIIFITVRGLLQALVIQIIAILVGATVLSLWAYIATFAILALFGVFVASFGTTIALYLGEHDSYAAAQSFLSMPLYLASTAMLRYDQMPAVLFYIAKVNPLSYAIDAARMASSGTFPLLEVAVLVAVSVVMALLCIRMFRRATIS
ncbi:MAG: ABC transporter permease [Candidatus Methanomethylophilaceae archaeon]|jgi:ABC-2 type transport system permease protein|nr:ABC transporter permease [Candidatus Methanomethylophilaceae archaeon]MDD3128274.1 ABC transporter permease [Candidatus Methanomethylophilaceae archaeon]MDD4119361.1 ABC transporter permease [Candidatus Methanomethylophilaceae archaeon]MDD4454979.1 ABC transporter permease [Candidatus Methanomethylophilaceae archaeon]